MLQFLVFASAISLASGIRCTTVNGIPGACNYRLNDIVLAGAHNAGAGAFGILWHWSSGLTAGSCFYRNQDVSITRQMELGIRYFDFDTSYIWKSESDDWWEPGIILCHANAYTRSLKRALKEIDVFLGDHPNEIVVIRLKDTDQERKWEIRNSLVEEFAEAVKNTALNPNSNPWLKSAIENNQRMVVYINGADLHTDKTTNMHKLAQIESYKFTYALKSCYEVDDVVDRLTKDDRIGSKSYPVQVDWYQSVGMCNSELARLCDEDEFYKLKDIDKKLREKTGRGINLVLIDYVGTNEVRLADVILDINKANIPS